MKTKDMLNNHLMQYNVRKNMKQFVLNETKHTKFATHTQSDNKYEMKKEGENAKCESVHVHVMATMYVSLACCILQRVSIFCE